LSRIKSWAHRGTTNSLGIDVSELSPRSAALGRAAYAASIREAFGDDWVPLTAIKTSDPVTP